MKSKTLHMIGNAHIDPVWLWQWQEGFQEIKATFRSALDRLAEEDDFYFVASSAAFYEWVEENDPQMFDEIRQRVAEGRWEPVGGWWVEPDCNLPSGESFVRQALYGQHYFHSRFGHIARVGFNPDSFGHHAMLPQILSKSGLDSYCFLRPDHNEMTLPARLFNWRSPDGSSVLTFRIPYGYCTGPEDLEPVVRQHMDEMTDSVNDLMCFYGVGNHGGGPTRENLASIKRMNSDEQFPTMRFATPGKFFAQAARFKQNLPTVDGELQHHARGCYAAHSGVKAWNRRAEQMLVTAEKFSAVAEAVVGLTTPREAYTRGWKSVLFNQFHDILAGTSLEAAYDDARDSYGEAMAIASRGLNHAVQALAWRVGIEAEDGMLPVVVFNPHGHAAKLPIEVEWRGIEPDETLLDERGDRVPHQAVRGGANVRKGRARLTFVADLPALGYRVFRMVRRGAADRQPPFTTPDVLENESIRIIFDEATAGPTSLFDKRAGQELLSAAVRAVVIDDPSDTWSHGVRSFKNEIGQFVGHGMRILEHGPVLTTIRTEATYDASRLRQDFILYRGLPYVEVRVRVDWRERQQVLKLLFPTRVQAATATWEVPYGTVTRPNDGEEQPSQTWIDLSQPGLGLALINDSKYSHDVDGGTIGMTALRSPIYAHHDPYVPDPAKDYSYIDHGISEFRYILMPHAGDWKQAGVVSVAAHLNARPVALRDTYHAGNLPQWGSFAEVAPANIVLSALKQAEDGTDLIVRCHEAHGVATDARLHLHAWGRTLEARFTPYEIKTFRVPLDASQRAREVNLLET